MAASEKRGQAQRESATADPTQEWPQPGSDHHPTQSDLAGLVWLLRARESPHLLHLGQLGAWAAAVDFARASKASRASARARSSTLAERLLWLGWAVLSEGSLAGASSVSCLDPTKRRAG